MYARAHTQTPKIDFRFFRFNCYLLCELYYLSSPFTIEYCKDPFVLLLGDTHGGDADAQTECGNGEVRCECRVRGRELSLTKTHFGRESRSRAVADTAYGLTT